MYVYMYIQGFVHLSLHHQGQLVLFAQHTYIKQLRYAGPMLPVPEAYISHVIDTA